MASKIAATAETIGNPLEGLNRRLSVIRDRVSGVAMKSHNGFYLFGRAGTSKTHTVRTTLEGIGTKYEYHSGHLTPIGLFELLDTHHDRVIVLDDVSSIFKQTIALQILLAALGTQAAGSGFRIVKYRKKGVEQTVRFTGGIIGISNLELHGDGVLTALKSRVNYLKYNPTDEQMEAMIRAVAGNGWSGKGEAMKPEECLQVAEFLITESHRLSIRLDMRNLVDKGYPDYLQHRNGHAETHWKDLIRTTLEEQLVDLQHTAAESSTREETKRKEQMIAKTLAAEYPDRQSRFDKWFELTGKGERAMYRRMSEVGI